MKCMLYDDSTKPQICVLQNLPDCKLTLTFIFKHVDKVTFETQILNLFLEPEPVEGNGILRNYNPDFLPPQTSVDNPEYHLVAGPTLGIPHPTALPHPPATGPSHKSSEEESDHEYYNDFDRLQRELQPLRRNETTVQQC